MFDIGWSEMAMVALIALVIMGPKELPKAMRNFAHFTRKMRRYAQDFRAGVDNIVREAELEEARDTLNKARSLNPRKALEDFQPEQFREFKEDESADLGALVEVVYPDRAKAAFLLATRGGGMMTDCDGVTVMVVTPGAPVFGNLSGKHAGDELVDPPMKISRIS